jgi:hypothetical protein
VVLGAVMMGVLGTGCCVGLGHTVWRRRNISARIKLHIN